MLPPVPTLRRLQQEHDFEAYPRLRHPLPTLHARRCRRSCKARFRLAGCAFAGRELNPLDRFERFQATSILLSRTSPDASWAHARRNFFELFEKAKSPVAEEALRRIQALYAIEQAVAGKPAGVRLAARQEHSRKLLEAFKAWAEEQRRRLSGKTALGKAFQYALARWPALTQYLADGRLNIDNNVAERLLRGIAVTRKNFLFLGSDRGGERAAVLYAIIETARLNDLNPEAYLADIIDRLAKGHLSAKLDELLPWNYAKLWPQKPDPNHRH
jgi:hypothetical protein